MVRKYGLRTGDAVTGARSRQPARGRAQRQKYNPLVRLDTVNGDDAGGRPTGVEFAKLTPLYPTERLRLETEPTQPDRPRSSTSSPRSARASAA